MIIVMRQCNIIHVTQYPHYIHTWLHVHVHGIQYPSLHTCTCTWSTVSLITTYMYPSLHTCTCTWNTVSLTTYMYSTPQYIYVHVTQYPSLHTCTWNIVSLTTYMYMYIEHSIPHYIHVHVTQYPSLHTCTCT